MCAYAYKDTAVKALDILSPCAGTVVKLCHVNFTERQGVAMITLMDNFDVEEIVEGHVATRAQLLKRLPISHIPQQASKTRISLTACSIMMDSEHKEDKNGNPYRSLKWSMPRDRSSTPWCGAPLLAKKKCGRWVQSWTFHASSSIPQTRVSISGTSLRSLWRMVVVLSHNQ